MLLSPTVLVLHGVGERVSTVLPLLGVAPLPHRTVLWRLKFYTHMHIHPQKERVVSSLAEHDPGLVVGVVGCSVTSMGAMRMAHVSVCPQLPPYLRVWRHFFSFSHIYACGGRCGR